MQARRNDSTAANVASPSPRRTAWPSSAKSHRTSTRSGASSGRGAAPAEATGWGNRTSRPPTVGTAGPTWAVVLLSPRVTTVLLLVPASFARTIVVEADGSGEFTSIADAVAVALPGDTVRVGDGTFGPFATDREVTVESRNGGGATRVDGAGLTAVYATATVTLRGLHLTSAGATAIVLGAGGSVLDCTVHDSGDEAAGYGGALHLGGGDATVEGSTFEQNAALAGGAIYVAAGASLAIADSTFDTNAATDGGAVYATRASITADNVVWTANYAANYGGALFLDDYAALTETGGTYTDNMAYSYGGAIYAYYGVSIDQSGVAMDDNTALYGYGAHLFHYYYGDLTIADSTLSGGLAYYDAGAIYAWSLYDVDIRRTDIVDNVATYGSGGAASMGACRSLVLDDVDLSRNTAYYYGGALYLAYGLSSTISSSRFEYNAAGYYSGGAIHWDGASQGGGALTLASSTIRGNVAAQAGGGLYVVYAEEVAIDGNYIGENVAGNAAFGGGLFVRRTGGRLRVGNNEIVSNTAGYGGGIYAEGTMGYEVDDLWHNNVVAGNTAGVGGGACFVHEVTTELVNNTFAGNAASASGGALCVNYTALNLVNTAIAYTSAGAAIHAYDAESGAALSFSHDAFYANAAGDASGDLATVEAAVTADPRFLHWDDNGTADDSFALAPGSPLVDAGHPDLVDLDGSPSDIGAFGGPLLVTRDADADGVGNEADCDDHDGAVTVDCPDPDVPAGSGDSGAGNEGDQDTAGVRADPSPRGEEGCGCAGGGPSGGATASLVALSLLRTRSRRGGPLAASGGGRGRGRPRPS